MKLNQSLTAAITAAALVAGAGFAYAQTNTTTPGTSPGDVTSRSQGGDTTLQSQGTTGASGSTNSNSGSMNSNSTMQAQPSTSSGTTSMDNSATSSTDSTLEPRADRN